MYEITKQTKNQNEGDITKKNKACSRIKRNAKKTPKPQQTITLPLPKI